MATPTAEPCSYSTYDPVAAADLGAALGLPAPVAAVLARRGYADPESARRFLAADTAHEPTAFPDLARALELIRSTIAAGGPITVHGDYDADGVCATAILVEALRSLDARCDWFIPSRLADGYGLDASLAERLAERETALLVTVDCGIGSRELIGDLRARGVEVIVTDHHALPERLPDCPILHPAIGYPFAGLCGSAIAAKLAEALTGEATGLDLAALATIADAVPLVGENRRIVREGLRQMSAAPRPGLRALMAVCSVEPERVSAREVSFRIAPRINAAGRLYRADAGVELMLTESIERATEIASELDRANIERREIEAGVVAEAGRQASDLLRDGPLPALVLAGRGWHPGVVGIAASRMVDRHGVPVLMIAIDEAGIGVGSGRSVPGVNLLEALSACGDLLNRFGGHAAAAGLEVDAARIDELRSRFATRVGEVRAAAGPPTVELDGVLAVGELSLEMANALAALGPFGQANPEPRFAIVGARAERAQPMGEEGRHARLMLSSGGRRAAAVAFGAGSESPLWDGGEIDATLRLELNEWNGSVSARAVIDSVRSGNPKATAGCCGPAAERATQYIGLVEAWLDRILPSADSPRSLPAPSAARRPERPALAALAELVTSGRRVVAITADARRRAEMAARIATVTGVAPAVACSRCATAPPNDVQGLLISDWATLGYCGDAVSADLVAIVDPPPGETLRAAALGAIPEAEVFELWGPGETAFALACLRDEWDTRANAAAIYRGLRGPAEAAPRLAVALAGEGAIARTPGAVARALRVLSEVGLVEVVRQRGSGGTLAVRVVSSERTELERSEAFRRFAADHRAGEAFLSKRQSQAA